MAEMESTLYVEEYSDLWAREDGTSNRPYRLTEDQKALGLDTYVKEASQGIGLDPLPTRRTSPRKQLDNRRPNIETGFQKGSKKGKKADLTLRGAVTTVVWTDGGPRHFTPTGIVMKWSRMLDESTTVEERDKRMLKAAEVSAHGGPTKYVPDNPKTGIIPSAWRHQDRLRCPSDFCSGQRDYRDEWDAADHGNFQHSPVIPRYLCPVSKCPFYSHGVEEARAHLVENERESNHRAKGLTERSLPDLVTLGSNPNYIASGPPVRPGTSRTRRDSLERKTQDRFESLLNKEEGHAQVADVPAYKKFKAFHTGLGEDQALDHRPAVGGKPHPVSRRAGRVWTGRRVALRDPPTTSREPV